MNSVEVKGLRELREALLKTVPAETQGKVLQVALAKASQPVTKAARALAPTKTGRLRKAIYSFRDRVGESLTYATRSIGVRKGGSRGAFYWRWIEFGRAEVSVKTRKRGTAKSLGSPEKGFFGTTVRAVAARPFLRPAFESNKGQTVDVFGAELWKQIKKAAARAASRSPKAP